MHWQVVSTSNFALPLLWVTWRVFVTAVHGGSEKNTGPLEAGGFAWKYSPRDNLDMSIFAKKDFTTTRSQPCLQQSDLVCRPSQCQAWETLCDAVSVGRSCRKADAKGCGSGYHETGRYLRAAALHSHARALHRLQSMHTDGGLHDSRWLMKCKQVLQPVFFPPCSSFCEAHGICMEHKKFALHGRGCAECHQCLMHSRGLFWVLVCYIILRCLAAQPFRKLFRLAPLVDVELSTDLRLAAINSPLNSSGR